MDWAEGLKPKDIVFKAGAVEVHRFSLRSHHLRATENFEHLSRLRADCLAIPRLGWTGFQGRLADPPRYDAWLN